LNLSGNLEKPLEVPEDLAEKVIRSVDDVMMKGRRVKVQKETPSLTNML